MSVRDDIGLVRAVLAENKERWDRDRPLLRRLRDLYGTKFWSSHKDVMFGQDAVRVETSDPYSFVEAYVASLYTKAPSVEVAHDATADGDTAVTSICCNSFVYKQREEQERATRIALIYPFAFYKLAPRQSTDLLDRVTMRACQPWESLLDLNADRWDEQRWVGHSYYITLPEAREKYGAKTSFKPRAKEFFFKDDAAQVSMPNEDGPSVPEAYQYVQIVELWHFEQDKLIVWSPDYAEGKRLLKRERIPLRDFDDSPMSTIVPLYYAYEPDTPLHGYSTLYRSYDQFVEKNIFRTAQANMVRRATRQYLMRKDALNAEEMAKLTSGLDGAVAEYEGSDSLAEVLREVDKSNMSADFDKYLEYLDQDMSRASLLAPFTKGEATKATATEVTALASYSASEIGRLARCRDGSIEKLAHVVTRIYHLYADAGEKAVVKDGTLPKVVTPEALNGRFRYTALDQASTPLSDAMKRQQFLALLPNLQTVGIPVEKLREHMVREFELPEDFLDVPEPVSDPTRMQQVDTGIAPAPPGMTSAESLAQNLQTMPLGEAPAT